MRKHIRKISIFFMVMAVFLFPSMRVLAAGASVTVSSATASNGQEVSVTVSVKGDEDVAMVDLWLAYDASILEYVSGADVGGGGSIRILSSDNSSFTLKFKAVNAGTATISVNTAQSMVSSLYTDVLALTASNGTVTVKAPASYSSDNTLSSLTISPGTLSPAFSKEVTTYNTSVPADCKRLVISAVTSDSKATISIWGAALDPGDNTTKITVTAEDGSKKVYTIYTKRPYEQATQAPPNQEKPTEALPTDVLVTIAGREYFVVSNFDENLLPEGYEEEEYNYKGSEVVTGKGLSNGLRIFYLETAAESGSEKLFFIYDEEKDEFAPLQRLNSKAVEYTIITDEMTEGPMGYYPTMLELNGQQIQVWVENSAEPSYFLFYGMNVNGQKGWYQYDLLENTIQTGFVLNVNRQNQVQIEENSTQTGEPATVASSNDDFMALKSEYEHYAMKMRLVLLILIFLLAAVIVVFIVFIIKSFAGAGGQEDEYDIDEHDEIDFEEEEKRRSDDDDDDFTFIDLD